MEMESISLEQTYYIGELIGVVVVIATVLYLAKQVAQSNKDQRLAAVQQHNEGYRQNLALLSEHTEVWEKGLTSMSNLSSAEQIEFALLIQLLIRHTEQSFVLMKEGVLNESSFRNALDMRTNIMSYPGAREWWRTRRSYFDPEFLEYFEDHLSEKQGSDIYGLNAGN